MRYALLIGQALDAATFALAVTLVPALGGHEQNPIIATAFAVGGVAGVVALKMGWTSFLLWRLSARPDLARRRAVTAIVCIAVASGFVGAAFNLRALAAFVG